MPCRKIKQKRRSWLSGGGMRYVSLNTSVEKVYQEGHCGWLNNGTKVVHDLIPRSFEYVNDSGVWTLQR